MSQYPNLADGQPLRQTTRKTLHIGCSVIRFLDMTEQRYITSTPVYHVAGTYQSIYAADYIGSGPATSLQDFYDAMQGRFGQFNVTLGGTLITNLYFDTDRIVFDEKSVNNYSTSVTLKSFPAAAFPTITVVDPVLPTLGDGTTGPKNQYPNQLSHAFSNAVVDLEAAGRVVYSRIASPIAGGVLTFHAITDTEADIFEHFFIQLGGMYGIFTLNYNNINYVNCRFDTMDLVRDYSGGPNVNRFSLPWVAIPVPAIPPPALITQSTSAARIVEVQRNHTGVATVTATFGSLVAAGATIIVGVGGVPNAPGPNTVLNPVVTDSLGNTYTQIQWANASTQIMAVGLFMATNVLGGPAAVTFTVDLVNGNPIFDLAYPVAVACVETTRFLTVPTVHNSGLLQVGAGSGTLSVTLSDTNSVSVGTSFGTVSQNSLAVADIAAGAGTDYFVAARVTSTATPTAPTVTAGGYVYTLQENHMASDGSFVLGLWVT